MINATGIYSAQKLYLKLLRAHKRILINGGDDYHGHNIFDKPLIKSFIMTQSYLNENDISVSIKNGEFYVSTNPLILDLRIVDNDILIETSPVKNIVFYNEWQMIEIIDEKSQLEFGKYKIKTTDEFIWIKLIDKYGNHAWSQPIFLK